MPSAPNIVQNLPLFMLFDIWADLLRSIFFNIKIYGTLKNLTEIKIPGIISKTRPKITEIL